MPTINVESFDFTPLPAGLSASSPVDFAWNELLTATVTVGKSRADTLLSRWRLLASWREILWRVALLKMAVSSDGTYFIQSPSYNALDPSEKVGVSYMLGLTASSALCTRFLDMPFLMHLDVYGRGCPYDVTCSWLENLRRLFPYQRSDTARLDAMIASLKGTPSHSTFKAIQHTVLSTIFGTCFTSNPSRYSELWSFLLRLTRNSRPDLFGVELNSRGVLSRCVIVEAKGRSGELDSKDRIDCKDSPSHLLRKLERDHGGAMLQALSRDKVNGVDVGRHLAIFSHFEEPRGRWKFSWKDPQGKELSKNDIKMIPLGSMVADYYAGLLALGCVEMALNMGDDSVVKLQKCARQFLVKNSTFSIEFHPELHDALQKAFALESEKRDIMTAEIPSMLALLKNAKKIGDGTDYGINGVRVSEMKERN